MDLTEKQWEVIEPLLKKPAPRPDGKGRPRIDDRGVLNGILWILRTGARWEDLPPRYPSRATCHRRFQQWCDDGTMRDLWEAIMTDLDERGKFDWSEAFIDGSFAAAKKGAPLLARLNAEKARSGWQWSTAMVCLSGLPSTARRRRK